jgi:hypothetical protein
MTWLPLLQYSFENHVAVDETGNGHTGIVSLPNPGCWVDNPDPAVATAIRYDNPQSQVTVPQAPTLGGWPGFRVRVVFSPANFNRRIDLVEGDLSFALFVEKDASVQGTINDGQNWYGVASQPGVIVSGEWYSADFEYNPATTMILRLNGTVVDMMVTHGAPVGPVGPAGIKIGYWPGGDDRYTFLGLIGPVAIDTLDPVYDAALSVGKVVCPDGSYQLETSQQIYQQAFTPAEQAQAKQLGAAILDGAEAILASILSTSADQTATIAAFEQLQQQFNNLLISDEAAGINMYADPQLAPLLSQALNVVWSVSGNARDTLLVQALKLGPLLAAMSPDRAAQIRAQFPGLCDTIPTASGFDPTPVIGGPLQGILGGCCPPGGGTYACPCGCPPGTGGCRRGTPGTGTTATSQLSGGQL